MHLLLLDIDGTLTDTNDVDTSSFAQAISKIFSIRDISTDWSVYPHATDSGITNYLIREQFGRLPREDELIEMQDCFHSILEDRFLANPSLCKAIPGGPQFLKDAVDQNRCAVAFATGGWETTAKLKLTTASYEFRDTPFGTANDAWDRIDICRAAAKRALSFYDVETFDSTTYVGDGIWDVQAAHFLGYKFVGVGNDQSAEVLKAAGAESVIPNFQVPGAVDCLFAVALGPH